MTPEELGMTSALIVGLVTVAKQVRPPNRVLPVLPLAFGIVMACLIVDAFGRDTVLYGLISGLSAMGLWSGGKTVAGK